MFVLFYGFLYSNNQIEKGGKKAMKMQYSYSEDIDALEDIYSMLDLEDLEDLEDLDEYEHVEASEAITSEDLKTYQGYYWE